MTRCARTQINQSSPNRLLTGLPLLAALLLGTSCTDDTAVALQVDAEDAELTVELTRPKLRFARAGAEDPLLESATFDLRGVEPAKLAAFAMTKGQASVKMRLGAFGFRDTLEPWRAAVSGAGSATAGQAQLVLGDGQRATLDVERVADGVVRVRLDAPADLDRVAMSFVCHPDDQFLGLGAQTPKAHRGQIVPLWTKEQGIGKLDKMDHYGAYSPTGQTYDAYLPIPVLFNPRGYMVLIEGTHRVLLDLCATDSERWRIEQWRGQLSLVLVTGKDPLQMIERMTAVTGRASMPAPWVFGPWLDAVKGPQHVRDVAKAARDNDIPASAIWTEDWAGGQESAGGYHLNYQWSVDKTLYPDFAGLAGELHDQGFRFLGYFNPFILEGTAEWTECQQKGLLVKDAEGKVITFPGPPRLETTALLDFSNEATKAWAKAKMQTAVDLGLDGWMADFAEWLPWEAKLADGRSGAEAHNDYPRLWQQLNQEFFAQAKPDGDFAYFVRSGWTGTQALAPAIWAGDQNTDFKADDGLPTVVTIGLNLGLSGVAFYGHDIAGYTSLISPPSDKELFYRWTQLGAFSPLMRTHHGTTGDQAWSFDKDADTLAFFGRYARVHAALYPYLRGLAQQAVDKGWPLWRPLHLHYPRVDPTVGDQFLLGDALLVAPVVVRGQRKREVLLPPGRFYNYWTGELHDGGSAEQGKTISVDADLETIPVFARAGAVIPLLPDGIQTLAKGSKGLTDLAALKDRYVVRLYHGADGSFTLEDGTVLTLAASGKTPAAGVAISAGGEVLSTCAGVDSVGCFRQDAGKRIITIELEGAGDALKVEGQLSGEPSFTFEAPFTAKTRLTLELRY
jgi:alpha-glucosidase